MGQALLRIWIQDRTSSILLPDRTSIQRQAYPKITAWTSTTKILIMQRLIFKDPFEIEMAMFCLVLYKIMVVDHTWPHPTEAETIMVRNKKEQIVLLPETPSLVLPQVIVHLREGPFKWRKTCSQTAYRSLDKVSTIKGVDLFPNINSMAKDRALTSTKLVQEAIPIWEVKQEHPTLIVSFTEMVLHPFTQDLVPQVSEQDQGMWASVWRRDSKSEKKKRNKF